MLKPDEVVHLNADRVAELYEQLGEAGAEEVVCRALEEMAARLSHTERCHREGRRADMGKSARGLVAISDQIGMHLLSLVAADVAACAHGHDPVATAATLSRLLRIGDRSLSEVCDLRDLTI